MRSKQLFLVAALWMGLSPTVEAKTFTVKEVRTRCENEAGNALGGALVGGAIGCGVGFLIGDNGRSCAAGAAIGGVTGGLIGLASSCKDEVRYITYFDRALDSRRVSRQYERWDGEVSGRILAHGRHKKRGYVCKKYETQIGHSNYSTVACKVKGVWHHNVPNHEFVEVKQERREIEYRYDRESDVEEILDEDYGYERQVKRKKCCKVRGCYPNYNPYPATGSYQYQYQYNHSPYGYQYQYQYQVQQGGYRY